MEPASDASEYARGATHRPSALAGLDKKVLARDATRFIERKDSTCFLKIFQGYLRVQSDWWPINAGCKQVAKECDGVGSLHKSK
jgi:hypothetical protein